MKYKFPIIIALVVITAGVFASLSSIPTEAQRRKIVRMTGNTGIIPLGLTQKVRVTVLNRGSETLNIQFRYTTYNSQCDPPEIICSCTPGNAENSEIIQVPPGQAISQERTGEYNSFGIFAEGENLSENVVITSSIIDGQGQTLSYIAVELSKVVVSSWS